MNVKQENKTPISEEITRDVINIGEDMKELRRKWYYKIGAEVNSGDIFS